MTKQTTKQKGFSAAASSGVYKFNQNCGKNFAL
jgi:hypothetical protein